MTYSRRNDFYEGHDALPEIGNVGVRVESGQDE